MSSSHRSSRNASHHDARPRASGFDRGTRTVLGRTGVGVAIPQGAPKPAFNSTDALKASLITAKFIATSGQGSSGRYVLTLLDRLGIADQVKPKIKSGASGMAAKLLAAKEVDFAVIGLPPVTGIPGVEWLGYLPDDLNSWLPFTGAVNAAAKEPAAGRALHDHAAASRERVRHTTETPLPKVRKSIR